MQIVKVAKNGKIIIPPGFRKQLGIEKGGMLIAEAVNEGFLLRPVPKLEDMAGVYAKYGTPEEIKKEIDKMREEY